MLKHDAMYHHSILYETTHCQKDVHIETEVSLTAVEAGEGQCSGQPDGKHVTTSDQKCELPDFNQTQVPLSLHGVVLPPHSVPKCSTSQLSVPPLGKPDARKSQSPSQRQF